MINSTEPAESSNEVKELNNKKSYGGILKTSGVVGGSQVLQIIIGAIRTKVIATVLGTAGIGIVGLYQAIVDLVRSSTSLGINMAAVKDIAEVNARSDSQALGRVRATLQLWAWLSGFLGCFVLLVTAPFFSTQMFGDSSHTLDLAILSISIVMVSVSAAQLSLLQGLQLYKKLAVVNVLGAVIGLVLSVPMYLLWGLVGIVPSLLAVAFVNLVVSWVYYPQSSPLHKESLKKRFVSGFRMIKLGIFLVINGLLAIGTLFLIRSFLSLQAGVDSVGLFQAAWQTSTVYIGIVLNAMFTDFFPRLSAASGNNTVANRLTNEQSEITLLLGAPLLTGLLTFSPQILSLFYSDSFLPASILLKLLIAASFFVLVSWPVGVILIAKGRGLLAFLLDLFGSAVMVCIVIFGWNYAGLVILGIAYLTRVLLTIPLVLWFSRLASGFEFSGAYFRLLSVTGFLFLLGLVFSLLDLPITSLAVNIGLTLLQCGVTLFALRKRVDIKSVLTRLTQRKETSSSKT